MVSDFLYVIVITNVKSFKLDIGMIYTQGLYYHQHANILDIGVYSSYYTRCWCYHQHATDFYSKLLQVLTLFINYKFFYQLCMVILYHYRINAVS